MTGVESTRYTTVTVPFGKRFMVAFGSAFIWFSLNLWIPILGWILLLFTPVVFVFCLFSFRKEKRGHCPYCLRETSYRFNASAFKCAACREKIFITETSFVQR